MEQEQTTTDYTDWRRTIEALRRVPKLGGLEIAAPCIFQFACIRACLAVALRRRVDSQAFRKSSHNAMNRSTRICPRNTWKDTKANCCATRFGVRGHVRVRHPEALSRGEL